MSLRVLHTVASVGDTYGGVASALHALGDVERKVGHDASLVTLHRPEQGTTLLSSMPHFDVELIRPGRVAGRLHGGRRLTEALHRLVPQHDLVVLHGVFDLTSVVGGRTARRFGVPYLLWPHGSLDPYDLVKHRGAKRRLAPLWRETLAGAAALLCTTAREAELAETFGAEPRREVLPLPVSPPALPDRERARAQLGIDPDARVVLFCGRIDHKKGLPLLLEVFAAAAGPADVLVVAGSGDAKLLERLRAKAAALPCADRVRFPGWVDAAGRAALLAAADVFALLSDNENFSVATAEALRAGVPCLISDNVYLADQLARRDAAAVTPAELGPATEALCSLLVDSAERAWLATAGREWSSDNLDLGVVSERYRELVREVMSTCPQSVY
ncbi:glycosyltransferase [Actinokineospora bangkokensis]|uniref:Glycosyltransferase subfamily 4-like N-terminal domain-containing protein n=1 Tax=Actinokineospora bangkokensis TaxID=1193682 RepID=A0A1Q9LJD9_9PSEU|nr:glycosyltransferase [Actinokineospora bangkokensis]OLR92114.1 hypothetical protein BJP25_22485 [Actinokineospora bangkokensis]